MKYSPRLLTALASTLLFSTAHSDVVDWGGTGPGNKWTTPENWRQGKVPTKDKVIISTQNRPVVIDEAVSPVGDNSDGPDGLSIRQGKLALWANSSLTVESGPLMLGDADLRNGTTNADQIYNSEISVMNDATLVTNELKVGNKPNNRAKLVVRGNLRTTSNMGHLRIGSAESSEAELELYGPAQVDVARDLIVTNGQSITWFYRSGLPTIEVGGQVTTQHPKRGRLHVDFDTYSPVDDDQFTLIVSEKGIIDATFEPTFDGLPDGFSAEYSFDEAMKKIYITVRKDG